MDTIWSPEYEGSECTILSWFHFNSCCNSYFNSGPRALWFYAILQNRARIALNWESAPELIFGWFCHSSHYYWCLQRHFNFCLIMWISAKVLPSYPKLLLWTVMFTTCSTWFSDIPPMNIICCLLRLLNHRWGAWASGHPNLAFTFTLAVTQICCQ